MVISVGELMLKEKVLTEVGLKILHNNIENDMETLTPDDPQKITRTAIYFTIVYNMAVLFAGYCAEHNLDDPRNEQLRQIGVTVVAYIPMLLRGLDEKHLEVYHGAKIHAFTSGKLFDDYFPQHPDEQKLLDKMNMKDNEYVSV